MLDYEFLYSFIGKVLRLHKSIAWVGIVTGHGAIMAAEKKKGTDELLTEEQNEEFSSSSITRYTSLVRITPKIGKTIYAFGRYKNICRATVPISDNTFLLLMFAPTIKSFDQLITKKIIPAIQSEQLKFDKIDYQ